MRKNNSLRYVGILVFALLQMCFELILRHHYNAPSASFYSLFFWNAIVAAIIVFSRSLILSIIYVIFVALAYVIQFSNFAYFGYWISPIDIWLLYKNIFEVSLAAQSVIKFHLGCLILIACAIMLTLSLLYCRKSVVRKSKLFTILGLIFLTYYPIRGFIRGNEFTLGQIPNRDLPMLKSSIYTFGFFIGRTIPEDILGYSKVLAYTPPSPTLNTSPLSDNIIVVMGESLSSEYMSAFEFQENTTPWLNSQKELSDRLLIKGFSGALVTDVSIPYFFNMVERPNARQLIAEEQQNLFMLAKQQGFKTAFYSTQPSLGLAFVSLLSGTKWIDDYKDPYTVTNDETKWLDDSALVSWLKNIELSDKNFIVLHQNGSHEPYVNRSPKEEKMFGQDSLYNEYLNSVIYTDKILSEIQDVVQTLPGSWTIIFTSDHGQRVTDQYAGKGSFDFPSNYSVPVYVATNQTALSQLARQRLAQCPYTFQTQVSHFVGELLGYKNNDTSCTVGYVGGKDVAGSSGYIKITQDDNEYSYVLMK